jgi:hypothetical protein
LKSSKDKKSDKKNQSGDTAGELKRLKEEIDKL